MQSKLLLRKVSNVLQTAFFLVLMTLLFIAVGYFISGTIGIVSALIVAVILFTITPRVSPQFVLKMYRAIPLRHPDAPGLYRIIEELSSRADLQAPPVLYYIPHSMTNAFSLGSKTNSAIALTDGLLRQLNADELSAVFAHEISHIRHGDLAIMNLADTLSRFIDIFSSLGIFLLLLYFPLYFMMGVIIPLPIIIILMSAPTFSTLLQLALSRTREYDADLGAVELTHDPLSLASALRKVEYHPIRFFDFLPVLKRRDALPSILRSHPVTQKRIDRLLQLAQNYTPRNIMTSDFFILNPDFEKPVPKKNFFTRLFIGD